jgi:hypothetical protein
MSRTCPDLSVVTAVSGRYDTVGARDFARRLSRLLWSLDRAAMGMPRRWLEVVVVDWNMQPERPPLRDALEAPEHVSLRVIEVPPPIHERSVGDSGRQFHEYAAKNVGVVRARSERVLVVNADVLVRPDLVRFCVRAPLGDQAFVRADRYDIRPSDVPEVGSELEVGPFVANVRHGPDPWDRIVIPVDPARRRTRWPRSRRLRGERGSSVIWGPSGGLPNHFLRGAHTNASGDFLCVSRAAWRTVSGLPEDPSIWLHGDSLIVAQLLGARLRQVIYAKPGALLHVDHPHPSDEARGGGGATWPAWLEHIQNIIDGRVSYRLNPGGFGLEDQDLAEHAIT